MRIVIENGEYWLRNHGDLAMLTVTISRIRERWPHARIAVLSDVPALLQAFFPGVEPITGTAPTPWEAPRRVPLHLERLGPRVIGPLALGKLRLRARLGAVARLVRDRSTRAPERSDATETSAAGPGDLEQALPAARASAVQGASLVVALGGGYLTDADPAQTVRALGLLEHAADHGVPTVMVGQGLGPLEGAALRRRAADVLPRVDLIALREQRRGPDILRRAGVSSDRVLVTGDDAVELAYAARREVLGSALGLCLRTSSYTPLQRASQEAVGRVVRSASARYDAQILPLLISEHPSEDRAGTLPLLRGASRAARPLPRFARPAQVAAGAARCRVVVTGAYHLAVFALSQGIPVVAMTSSRYYDDKFLGLGDMFGSGLTLVRLDSTHLEQELTEAIRGSWEQAPLIRDELRGRAREQIAASREAYSRIFALVEEPGAEGWGAHGPRLPDVEHSEPDR